MWFVLLLLFLDFVSFAEAESAPRITPAPAGPYRVEGNRILDANGHPCLLRGTEMPTVTLKTPDFAGDGKEFGPFSPSSFVTIRQRLNMNSVRLPVHYAAGGRTITAGSFAGVGHDNPAKDKLIHGFPMTARNRADLVAFLESLTDESVTRDARFADPWTNLHY